LAEKSVSRYETEDAIKKYADIHGFLGGTVVWIPFGHSIMDPHDTSENEKG
jgi:hypothetical protein